MLAFVVLSAAIGGVGAAPQDPPSPVKETKINVFEEALKAESLGQMVATADAVVIGDISGEPATRKIEEKGKPMVLTLHDVQIVEVVAGALPSKPAKITLARRGGSVLTGNERLTAINQTSLDLPSGRYVLFVDWSAPLDAYTIAYGADGAYRVTSDQLTPLGRSPIAQNLAKVRRPDLAAALKASTAKAQ
jgi:hypothetical protein